MYNKKMKKMWIGKTKDGNVVYENDTIWKDISDGLVSFKFINGEQTIELPDNVKYIQGKTASAPLTGGTSTIESRFFGFILGNNIVRVRINEKTNNIKIEVSKNG